MPDAWDQVREILATALELPAEQRTGFIRQACGSDQALLAEVESLLLHHDQADSLLENSPTARWQSFEPAAFAGKRIGAYKIVRQLGEGGMAVVYLGERDDEQFRKRVAIKMLRPGFYTAEIVHRFRNERQTLAALDHPNIVKLLDGGSTEDGLPYLVMDYVGGLPIDEFCALHQLSVPARLELFLGVCAAVQYAHQNLVIHRDLKPGNILITKDGVARLLDFGIAKLLNPEFLQTPLVTRTEWRPLTLEYASPEQLRGEPVAEASDVYSLGVVLYELLAGRRPFVASGRTRLEIERMVCDQTPERPSAAVTETGGRRALEGDLDTIILKALRKEPQQRYASVGELSEDIQHHLDGIPVKARNPTLPYRSGRFVRRHKESFATAMVALILVGLIGAWEVYRVWRKNPAEQTRKGLPVRARPSVAVLGFKNLSGRADAAWISTALSEMLTAQLGAGEELRTIAGDTVSQTKIDLGLLGAEGIPSNVLERIRGILGSGYVVVGSYLDSTSTGGGTRLDVRLEDTATGQTVVAASELGSNSDLANLASRIGARLRERLGLSKISELESQGIAASIPSNADALRLYSEGLAKLRGFDALGGRDLLTRAVAADAAYPLSHSALATVWRTLGHDADAREQAKQALDAAGKLAREDHLLVEARYYETIRNWGKAMETYEVLVSFFPDSLEYRIDLAGAKTSGGHGKDALNDLSQLARSTPQAGDDPRIDFAISEAASAIGESKVRRDAAEQAASKAERQGARLLAARARASECRALANLGENGKAAAACEEARRIFEETGDRGGLARALHSMAEVPLNQGDLAAAGKLYRQALVILREIGDEHGLGNELLNLGLIAAKQGDLAGGLKMYGESYRSYQQAGDKAGMAAAMGNTGNLLRAQGKLAEALTEFRQTLALSEEMRHRSSSGLSFQAIGLVLADQGDLPGASKMFQQALAIEKDIGEKSNYAETLREMGRVWMQQGKLDQARKSFDEALSGQEQLGEMGSAAETRLALGELACNSGRANEAEQFARAALKVFQAQNEPHEQILAAILLSRSLIEQGKLKDAAAALEVPLKLAEKNSDLPTRLSLMVADANVVGASNDLVRAGRVARRVLAEAPRDLFRLRLEASLSLGEIQCKGKNVAQGRERLQEVARAAKEKGFELIVRKALAAGGW
ncbi:MAG: protein kinase [Bryobacteraceae bacterium]|jgi:serine/threonine protein kinase/tetratricopeptide (TPR) repeat protein